MAVVGAHDGGHDGQAQAVTAAAAPDPGGVRAVEPFKDLACLDGVDAISVVTYLEPGATGGAAAHGDLDASAWGSVIHGVTHEIGDHLAQLAFVTIDVGWLELSG